MYMTDSSQCIDINVVYPPQSGDIHVVRTYRKIWIGWCTETLKRRRHNLASPNLII